MFAGLDFGTNSVRGVLVNSEGFTVKSCSISYNILELQDGSCLFPNPNDWLFAGKRVLNDLLLALKISHDNHDCLAIGVAFTSCTILPISENGDPIANESDSPYQRPHLFPKLWKHHSGNAQKASDDLTRELHDQSWFQVRSSC